MINSSFDALAEIKASRIFLVLSVTPRASVSVSPEFSVSAITHADCIECKIVHSILPTSIVFWA